MVIWMNPAAVKRKAGSDWTIMVKKTHEETSYV